MLTKKILVTILCALFILPFFWLPFGSVDLGGDASRLYFLEPVSYLYNFSLFMVVPQGIGNIEPSFFSLPYIFLLIGAKEVLRSSYLIISLTNAFKLTVAFLSIYLIVRVFLNKKTALSDKYSYYAAICAGLMYIFMSTMTDNWDRALLSHDQVFVNPVSFLLLLKFLLLNKNRYLIIFLFFSFIFSHSFAYTSAPAFFAFFPMAILFVFLYVIFIAKKKIYWRKVFLGTVLFVGLQAFHLVPQLVNLFDTSSYIHTRVFNAESIQQEGVRYYLSLLPLAKVSNYLLLAFDRDRLYMFFVPIIIIIGFMNSRVNKKLLIITTLFYIFCLLLLSANVTNVWKNLYQIFFYVPGFSMFRNFIGQWLFVFSFFYTLLFGQALYSCFHLVGRRLIFPLFVTLICLIIISGVKLITGESINRVLFPTTQTRVAFKTTKEYEESLAFIKKIPSSSKILTLPFTDSFYQVLASPDNKGVYVGPSTISYLGGKQDFAGYLVMEPFGNLFLKLVKEEKYNELKQLFGILNIEYIYWNSDKFVLDYNNEPFLYSLVGTSMPKNQGEYAQFISQLGGKEIFRRGYYGIYRLDSEIVVPHIYTPQIIIANNIDQHTLETHASDEIIKAFVDPSTCVKLKDLCGLTTNNVTIDFQKINPTRYHVRARNAKSPFMIVLSEAYNDGWKMYEVDNIEFNGTSASYRKGVVEEYPEQKQILWKDLFGDFVIRSKDQPHYLVNGYANMWKVNKANSNNDLYFIIELGNQHLFYFSAIISSFTLLVLVAWILLMLKPIKTIINK